MNKRKTIQLLRAARREIVRHGWCQHFWSQGRACCAGGAVRRVVGPDRYDNTDTMALYTDAMRYLHRACGCSPIRYNDQPGMTEERVLGRFDRAIVLVRRA